MKFLIITILMLMIILLYSNKEGLYDFSLPIGTTTVNPTSSVGATFIEEMMKFDTEENVILDLEHFNNTSNLMYGFQRIPRI